MFGKILDYIFREPHRDNPFKVRLVHNPFEMKNAKWRHIESNLQQGRYCGRTVKIYNMDLEPEDSCYLAIEFDHERNLYGPSMYGPHKLAREFINPNPLNLEIAEIDLDEDTEGWVHFWGGSEPAITLTDDFDLIVSMAKEFYITGDVKAMIPQAPFSYEIYRSYDEYKRVTALNTE